jgi:hypothetical protein
VLWNRNYFLRFHKPNPQKILLTIFNFDLNVLKCPILPLFTVPKHNYKLNNNLLTVEPRAVDPHCFDADPDPAQNLDADPDPDPGGGGGRSAKNVHPPWQNPRYAPGWGGWRASCSSPLGMPLVP